MNFRLSAREMTDAGRAKRRVRWGYPIRGTAAR
jgi:hypothetical protein